MSDVNPSAGPDEGLRASFAKAEAREPVWGVAEGFVPVEGRAVFRAWIALLGELRECAFELSDPRVTAVKCGWWAEEFDGLDRGAARHPLSRVLVRRRLSWRALAGPLLAVAQDLDPASDGEAAISALAPLAKAVVAVEARLFDGTSLDLDGASRALAIHWLRHRLERGLASADHGRVPLSLFARHGLRRAQLPDSDAAALRSDWARWLGAALPMAGRGWAYPRHLSVAVDRHALDGIARSGQAGVLRGFPALWQAWRSGRNAALQVRAPAAPTT